MCYLLVVDIGEAKIKELTQNSDNNKQERIIRNRKFLYDAKISYRYLRKMFSVLVRKHLKRNFKKILIVSDGNYSEELLSRIISQYPDKEISVLIPIFEKTNEMEKVALSFNFYLQNKNQSAGIYKLKNKIGNINIYGIYSDIFTENCTQEHFMDIKYLSPFMKCARIAAKILKPDLIHSLNLPFFLGAEFEPVFYPIKVLQQINDFADMLPVEPFWAFLNISNKKNMKKLCKDKIIQKCIASLFKQQSVENSKGLRECLEYVFHNYINFRTKINKDDIVEENIIFNRLNERVAKLFPQLTNNINFYYVPWFYTLKRADYWTVLSKTYYERLHSNPMLSFGMHNLILETKYKSDYVSLRADKTQNDIRFAFDEETFREKRKLNKQYLQKELSAERIRTNFTDETLFKDSDIKIEGYLDPFTSPPLFFMQFSDNAELEGMREAMYSVFKLVELNKVFYFIINYTGKSECKLLNDFIDFCKQRTALDGKWICINGKLNSDRFLSASDMILLPSVKNPASDIHFQAIKHGCIPVVTNNGIYNDTVFDILDDMTVGCGYKTEKPIDITESSFDNEYTELVLKAFDTYTHNPALWNSYIKNALGNDVEWDFESVEKYNKAYDELI